MTASMNEMKNQKSRKNYLETIQEVDRYLQSNIFNWSFQYSWAYVGMYSLKSMHRYFLKKCH